MVNLKYFSGVVMGLEFSSCKLDSFLERIIESSSRFEIIRLYLNFSQNSPNLFSIDKYFSINFDKVSVFG